MVVDVTCALVLALFGVLGAVRGLIRQVFSLVALVLIALFAVPLGARAAGYLAKGRNWTPTVTTHVKIALALAVAFAMYLAVKLVGFVVERALGRRHGEAEHVAPMAPWNRWWGAGVGVLKAGVLCWLVLCFFIAFPGMVPGAARAAEESWSGRTTRLYNPFQRWIPYEQRPHLEEALLNLWKLNRKHPAAWKKVVEEETVQDILQHERIDDLLKGKQTAVLDALGDPDFRAKLRTIDWEHVAEITEQALEEAD
jgi:uncharacterized membrane protein required for colicin V production